MDNLLTELTELPIRDLKKIARKFQIPYHKISKDKLIQNIHKRYCEVKKYVSYTYVRQLGREGKDGRTFLAIDENKNEVAIKIFKKNKSSRSIKREAKLQQTAAEHGISPRVLNYDGEGKYIVMEKLDINLWDCFCKQKGQLDKKQQKAIIHLFEELDKCKVFHGDPNPLNFMKKGNKWYVIDFGFAKPINDTTIAKYGATPNMKYMPLGFLKKIKDIYKESKLEYIEKYC